MLKKAKFIYLFVLLTFCIFNGADVYHKFVVNIFTVVNILPNLINNEYKASACNSNNLRYYTSFVYCIHYLIERSDTNLGFTLLDEYGQSLVPYRSSYLISLKSTLYWLDGEHTSSCDLLKQQGNYREMLNRAEASNNVGDWDGLQIYLSCIGKPNKSMKGISSIRIAELSYNLGKKYEQMNIGEHSLWAYENAIDWYPVIWAYPVLGMARIKEQMGLHEEAINLLINKVQIAEYPWTIFHLIKQLGVYLEMDGKWTDAYCAYVLAQQAAKLSPLNQVPDRPRNELDNGLVLLEKEHKLNNEQCVNYWQLPLKNIQAYEKKYGSMP